MSEDISVGTRPAGPGSAVDFQYAEVLDFRGDNITITEVDEELGMIEIALGDAAASTTPAPTTAPP